MTGESRSARGPKQSVFRRWLILQIGITVHRHFARRFEHVEIRRYIDIEKFSVNQKEPFGVSQTRKLRKIVGLDFGQTRRANFCQARCFIKRETASESRFLKLLAQT